MQRVPRSRHEHELEAPLKRGGKSERALRAALLQPHLHLPNHQLIVQTVRVRKHEQLGQLGRQEDGAEPTTQAVSGGSEATTVDARKGAARTETSLPRMAP